jgi:hypothetical protein
MNDREEIDNKLNDIEEDEQLQSDCENVNKYKNIGLEYIKKDAIKRLDELRKEFLNSDFHFDIKEINLINKVFNFLKDRA